MINLNKTMVQNLGSEAQQYTEGWKMKIYQWPKENILNLIEQFESVSRTVLDLDIYYPAS